MPFSKTFLFHAQTELDKRLIMCHNTDIGVSRLCVETVMIDEVEKCRQRALDSLLELKRAIHVNYSNSITGIVEQREEGTITDLEFIGRAIDFGYADSADKSSKIDKAAEIILKL